MLLENVRGYVMDGCHRGVYPASNTITIRETNFLYPASVYGTNDWDTRTIVPAPGVQYIYVNP